MHRSIYVKTAHQGAADEKSYFKGTFPLRFTTL